MTKGEGTSFFKSVSKAEDAGGAGGAKFRRICATGIIAVLLVACAVYVVTSARGNFERTVREELSQVEQNMQLRFSQGFNEQLALALQMAKSPLIVRYFENPSDEGLRRAAFTTSVWNISS